tara:strand:- start:88 stop:273 length:186 start_codon:yes stop_codon:yes gene_type:complete
MVEVFDKISLLILWDFAKADLSEFKAPNFVINLFFSFIYWALVKTYNEVKLKRVNEKADQT